MSTNIINIETLKERRTHAVIDADEAHWNAFRDDLVERMVTSRRPDNFLVGATLRALLDVIEAGGKNRVDAKMLIARVLNVFEE
jgi:hypothetical protein